MTFIAPLVKELRSRLRREYSAWVIFAYLLAMGLIGLGFLLRANAITVGYQAYLLRQIGMQLYALLALVQLFLIVFIAPALTATTIPMSCCKGQEPDEGRLHRTIRRTGGGEIR